MSHPSSIDLEAFATGDAIASVEQHLGGCAACAAFVEKVRRAEPRLDVTTILARARADEEPAPPRPIWIFRAATVALPLAAAAAVLLVLSRRPAGDLVPQPAPSVEPAPPTVSFKGGLQIAVIRDRGGEQERFTQRVTVRPGDRLRVEVALDREQAVAAAVRGEDGSWLWLMDEGARSPGTHFSERSARVDDRPLRGTLLVGPPEALARAKTSNRIDDVLAIPIEWELAGVRDPR